MKKILSIFLALFLTVTLFAGCSDKTGDGKDTDTKDTGSASDTKKEEAGEYKLGLGVLTDTDSSKDGTAQVDATIAAVITDGKGKIVDCYIDVAQNKMSVKDGVAEKGQTYKTKQEQGADYGMKGASGIDKEWNEQAAFFAGFVKGMTADEVSAIKTEKNAGGSVVAADEDLYAGCTIDISDMMQAVTKACKDDQAYSFRSADNPKVRIGAVTEDASSKDAGEDADGLAAMYTSIAAVVEQDGKAVACCIDVIEPKISFAKDGKIGEVKFDGSKRELKEDYGMKDASGIGKELYEQARAFADYVVGKTSKEVAGIETTKNDSGHMVAKDADLYAGCTVSIDQWIAAAAKAMEK